jgi:hypothetical protein
MSSEKLCPLKQNQANYIEQDGTSGTDINFGKCDKDRCEWWTTFQMNNKEGCCAIHKVSLILEGDK